MLYEQPVDRELVESVTQNNLTTIRRVIALSEEDLWGIVSPA